jgi:hypothetical protein
MMRYFMLAAVSAAVLLAGCANRNPKPVSTASAPQKLAAPVRSGPSVVDDPDELPSIQEVYATELSQIKIGMSLEEFRTVLPKAYVGGQSGDVTAYEIVLQQRYTTRRDRQRHRALFLFGSPAASVNKQVLWFYFAEDKLAKWGRPQDWPPTPKVIIENRNR